MSESTMDHAVDAQVMCIYFAKLAAHNRSPPLLAVCFHCAIIEPSQSIAATTIQRLVERVEAQQRN